MKTIHLFITVILWVLAVNTGMAQKSKQTFPNDSVEKKYYEKTYYVRCEKFNNLDPPSVSISNNHRVTLTGRMDGGCYNLKGTTQVADVIKKAFSKEKIKALALDKKNKVMIVFYYDIDTGQVVDLYFMLHAPFSEDLNSKTSITLRDINRLESLLKKYHFDMSGGCSNRKPNDKYGNWANAFWFYKLVDEEQKKSK